MRRDKWIVGGLILGFLALITVPFVYANFMADSSHMFGGFLLNPIDGNSYLAKMREGYDGAWLFTLPYTAHPGPGAAINLYYLFLGHLAKWTGLSLLVEFHLARLLGALLLSLALYRFFSVIFKSPRLQLWAFGLSLFGSGLGWLTASFGGFTSDFWVAEAYPFLSAYANPHFPVGLALQVMMLTPLVSGIKFDLRQIGFSLGGAALLSIIYPFGWLVVLVVLSIMFLWNLAYRAPLANDAARLFSVLFGGLPFAIYSFLVVNNHPVLSQWTRQNLTPAPALADLLLALSPAILLAFVGAYQGIVKNDPKILFLVSWLLVGLALVYFPSNLQRRFISGMFVPVVGLAIFAIGVLRPSKGLLRSLPLVLMLLSIPTNALILLGGIQAAKIQDPSLYLQRSELEAYHWLGENASGALVMAAPESGLLIPAYSDARVIYGHPFETPDAEARHLELESFFSGQLTVSAAESYLQHAGVNYVFYGPREKAIGSLPLLPDWRIVYENSDVQIRAPSP